ncbi:MAG: hypothetical protein KF752_11910 [Pirellulaceae bacterium]|nr:hypothetical protein [Pirellulaceae bacterium]
MTIIDTSSIASSSVVTPVVAAATNVSPEQPHESTAPHTTDVCSDVTTGTTTLVGVTADEFGLLQSLYESYVRFLTASKQQLQASKSLAEAQTQYDSCQDETRGAKEAFEAILKTLPEELVRIRNPEIKDIIESVSVNALAHGDATTLAQSDISTQPTSEKYPYDQWKSLPTQKLVDAGVAGLGKKKADILVEKYPTLGDLESLQASAVEARVHWSKLLPKGFGENVADAIFDAMSSLQQLPGSLSRNVDSSRDPHASIQPPIPETDDESESYPSDQLDEDQPALASLDVSDNDEDSLQYEDYEPDSQAGGNELQDTVVDPTLGGADWLQNLYVKISASPEDQKTIWGLNAHSKNSSQWNQGYKAQENGFEVEDCPYESSHQAEATEWIRGWIAALMNMDL